MRLTQLLLETAAKNIINEILNNHSNVNSIFIRIDKLGAQLGGNLKSAFVEMKYQAN
jgi:dihydroneopterin aldolase